MRYQVLIVMLVVAIPFAYGEKSTVDVPFISHGQSCSFDEIAVEYHCVWQGNPPSPMTIEELEKFKGGIHDRIIDEAIAKLEADALEEIAIDKAILTPTEKLIEKLEIKYAKGDMGVSDIVLLKMLYELDTCRQGMDNRTLHIQSPREFEISLANDYLYNHVNYDNKLGDLVKAIEECKGQQFIYKASVGYENMVGGEDDVQFDHRASLVGVQAVPFDKFTTTSSNIDMSAICDNHQFSDQHKAQAGCVVLYDGKTAEQIRLENIQRFGNSGLIGYESKVLDDYDEFMISYGNIIATVEDRQVQADIAEPIARELIEDNMFYQNQIKRGN
jgi:hypothetical protein